MASTLSQRSVVTGNAFQLTFPSSGETPPESPTAVIKALADPQQSQGLARRAAGSFYTPEGVADQMLAAVAAQLRDLVGGGADEVRVCDPFAGDGRLLEWLVRSSPVQPARWRLSVWDSDDEAVRAARARLETLSSSGLDVHLDLWAGDSFARIADHPATQHVVVTNPPWENLKPDHREMELLPLSARDRYRAALKDTARHLNEMYPRSKPLKTYGGWGTNLSRVGLEASCRLLGPGGVLGIVMPSSILADSASEQLREWFLAEHELTDLACFPAESRAFSGADVGACTLVAVNRTSGAVEPTVTTFSRAMVAVERGSIPLSRSQLAELRFTLPFEFGLTAARLTLGLRDLPTFGSLEGSHATDLWAGRELDETRIGDHLLATGDAPLFVKGRMIGRWMTREVPSSRVVKPGWRAPPSVNLERIVWRDISRRSQKRRLIATVIPPGWVAGNSLGVAHFRNGDAQRLRVLLGLLNSLAFEVQLRALLATGHVTLATLRKVSVPILTGGSSEVELAAAVDACLDGDGEAAERRVEILAARLYGFAASDMADLVSCFPGLSDDERLRLVEAAAT